MKPHRLLPLLGLAGALVLGACSKPAGIAPEQDTQLRAQALIDSGNASFRAKDFANAAKRYASAVHIRPEDPAAHYGLGMALSHLGRDDEARVAYARARELARQSGERSAGAGR